MRRWVSRSWICCLLAFKGRHRNVWGRGYTELFFLDEPTALAAGHRPCFECRRADARAFAAALASAVGRPLRAPEIDRRLHAERLQARAERNKARAERSRARAKRRHRLAIDELPDGAFLALPGDPVAAFAVRGSELLAWTPAGYGARRPRPRGITVDVLTPPSTLAALAHGYRPRWHASAGDTRPEGAE